MEDKPVVIHLTDVQLETLAHRVAELLRQDLKQDVKRELKTEFFAGVGEAIFKKAMYVIGIGVTVLLIWLAGTGKFEVPK
jgi:hypothetical protein